MTADPDHDEFLFIGENSGVSFSCTMSDARFTHSYIGCDLHHATTVVAVLDAEGKVVMETIVATEAAAIIRFVNRLSGPLHIAFEETTQARWMYDVVRGYLSEAIVCDPRRNKLLGEGSKADKPDARKLAELLRAGLLRPVYHGHEATRQLKELERRRLLRAVAEQAQTVVSRSVGQSDSPLRGEQRQGRTSQL
jgi:hypothetical protein